MTLDATPQPVSTMRRDIVSAYAATGAKIGSWLVAMALVFRLDANLFALFVLIRSTLSLLNYTTLGLAPAIIHRLSSATRGRATPVEAVGPPVLSYAGVSRADDADAAFEFKRVGYSALLLAAFIWAVGSAIAMALSRLEWAGDSARLWLHYDAGTIVAGLGLGLAIRLASDVCGAILQTLGRITADNVCLVIADVVWVLLMVTWALVGDFTAVKAATSFTASSFVLLAARLMVLMVAAALPRPRLSYFDAGIVCGLLGFGLLVSLAQLADFLYAPTDYWIIRTLLSLDQITVYAPAVQIDAALLLLVGGLATVLLPKAAAAHVQGNVQALRDYYVRGTLASLTMLAVAGLVTWITSPWIFRLWLGDPMPATRSILPLVLIHTVVGGSSAVGRSVLLGMGKVKPFTAAVLIAGASNVLLSVLFAGVFGCGLRGIILGTIIAVVGRCAIWQPWYVWRSLNRG